MNKHTYKYKTLAIKIQWSIQNKSSLQNKQIKNEESEAVCGKGKLYNYYLC